MEEKMKALMESEGFVEKMLSCEEPEQVQALFAENGIELSLEEVKAMGTALERALSNEDGELDEDALEDVAGGVSINMNNIIPSVIPKISILSSVTRIVRWFRRW